MSVGVVAAITGLVTLRVAVIAVGIVAILTGWAIAAHTSHPRRTPRAAARRPTGKSSVDEL
jgi:hypothetical protein